ncbi:MAG: subtilisin, partial [Isosphaeraceae bacterium]|nr:subtilisin [Isosphaeraceae bacterium]
LCISDSAGTEEGDAEGGAENGGRSGRIGGLAVDPSDPSGNTVYAGGASGGIWKTTDFLNPDGPTWIPLTDFGPTFGINIGGIAVFGRNNDPNQSIIFAATGEGDTGTPGVGFLRSMDGGATWTLLDSLDNTKPFAQRDHTFAKNGGTQAFQIAVDPRPTPSGGVIVYAALSGGNGGLWRSLDSGNTWQLMRAGQATDLVLDPNSGTGAPGGNLQILYAAFRGEGVFMSPNRGQVWNKLLGGIGDPLIHDLSTGGFPVPVTNTAPGSPGDGQGRIVLAKPALTGNPVQDLLYEGWLYVLVVTPGAGKLNGLYLTKDFGQNWTKVRLNTIPPVTAAGVTTAFAVPTNDYTKTDYELFAGPPNSGFDGQGNYDVSLAIDPTNPNIVYLGGTLDGPPSGYLRVDVTRLSDPHALVAFDNDNPDGGLLQINTSPTARIALDDTKNLPTPAPYLNLIRNPSDPFNANATINVINTARFNNTGADARWIPFDIGGTDQHRVVTLVDPLTGHARIIIGDDQGVFTAVDNNGTFQTGIGTVEAPFGSRNGNLQITQFYYGAAQPSNLAAQVAGAMFYGSAQDDGQPASVGDVLTSGNLIWDGPGGDSTGVATDQQGRGTQYQYIWPCCGGGKTDFFQVSSSGQPGFGVGRTFGLLQQSNPGPVPDPQWPFTGGSNFAVNPLDGDQIIMSSQAGRIFGTETQGQFWNVIGDPSALDGSYAPALAYGAPDPNAPGGIGNLGNFLYVGTSAGNIFVSRTGGGANGNQWTKISTGLDGSAVQAIVPNPTRGSHEAYAVTARGVYRITDSVPASGTPSWQNRTGNLFQVMHSPFGNAGLAEAELRSLTSLQVDWRYLIPDDPANPNGPTHPVLYVGGEGGVYRSLDNGTTWSLFPDFGPGSLLNAPLEGGGLPVAHVSDLDLALGNIDPTTGRPDVSTGPNILLATTYGRGSFAIRLAPIILPSSVQLDTQRQVVSGLSEQTAFGNVVTIRLLDLTNPAISPAAAPVLGTGPTDAAGRFAITLGAGALKGVRKLGIQAVNGSGTTGNLITIPLPIPTPAAPTLLPDDDSGVKGDNITNVNRPRLTGTAEPGTTVEILNAANAVLGSAPVTADGSYIVSFTNPLADGTYAIRVRVRDMFGNLSGASPALNLTIDTQAPAVTLALLSDDDSGVKGDGITNVRQPRLFGGPANPAQSLAGVTLQLIDVLGNISGTAGGVITAIMAPPTGPYVIRFPAPLPDGTYQVLARAVDVAGNIKDSPALVLKIQTQAPALQTTLTLAPADDTGVKGDGKTTIRRPHLIGHVQDAQGQPAASAIIELVGPGVQVTTVADAAGNYAVQLPSDLSNGTITLQARVRDVAGNPSTPSPALSLTIYTATGDYDGDGKTDLTTFRPTGPVATWTIANSSTGATATFPFGLPGDVPLQGDFDGDGRTDPAVYRPSNGTWYLLRSRSGFTQIQFGAPGDLPVAADYDGDGITDIGVYRPAAGQWLLIESAAGVQVLSFGAPNIDRPVPADFDGDGKTDLAVYRSTTGTWLVALSTGGPQIITYGAPGIDQPTPADYDGDGKADFAVYRPTTGQWLIVGSRNSAPVVLSFGAPGVDKPVQGDFDGDGRTDIAVYRPPSSLWLAALSATGAPLVQALGQPNDIPVPAPYTSRVSSQSVSLLEATAPGVPSGVGGPAPDFGRQAALLSAGPLSPSS